MKVKKIIMDWSPGMIYNLLEDAVKLAHQYDCIVEFPFNYVIVTVDKNTRIHNTTIDKILDSVRDGCVDVRV